MPNINNSIIDFNDFNAEPQLLRDIQDGKAIAFYSFAHLLLDTSGKPYTLPTGLYISGAYDTLQQLQSAFPTGNTNLYIVNADKCIYYWNGSAWTKGGTIDATYAFGVELQVPNTATNGTLTQEQFKQLSSNENAYILFNNERYLLMDKGHEADTWVYSHLGADITGAKIKVITINTSNRSWVLTDEEFVKDGTISAQKIQDGAVTTQKLGSDVILQIRKNDFASRFNSDRLNIVEAQINANKNTIEYTSDKPLEITCNGANIIDCNAHFKKVEGQTRRYSPNIYKMPNNEYTDESDRYAVKSETKTGIYTLTTKTFTGTISIYFDINWMPTVREHTTIANVTDTQFNLEMRKVEDGNSDWLAVEPHSVVVVDTTKHNAIRLYVQLTDDSANQNKTFIYKPMMLEGSYTYDELTPFQPYDNTLVNSKATFVSTARNLLGTINKYNSANNGITTKWVGDVLSITGTVTSNAYPRIGNITLPVGTYKIKYKVINGNDTLSQIYINDANGKWLGSNSQAIIISNSTPQPLSINLNILQGIKSDCDINIMLSIDDIPYEPYIKNISQYDIELGAFDYIENGNLVKQTSEMITFNGTENWIIEEVSPTKRFITYDKVSDLINNAVTINVITNSSLPSVSADSTWNNQIDSISGANGTLHIVSTSITTVEQLKQWLKANPITLVYQKATPTITSIVVPNGIVSYKNGLTSQEIKGKYLPYKYTAKYVNGGQQ